MEEGREGGRGRVEEGREGGRGRMEDGREGRREKGGRGERKEGGMGGGGGRRAVCMKYIHGRKIDSTTVHLHVVNLKGVCSSPPCSCTCTGVKMAWRVGRMEV